MSLERAVNWVIGESSERLRSQGGRFSMGEVLPESRNTAIYTMMHSRLNCGMVGAWVASSTPSPAMANRYTASQNTNSASEPLIGTPTARCTTKSSESREETRIIRPLARILAITISFASTGITSKCSIVPCSRSRITAAPTSRMVSRVALPTSWLSGINHSLRRFSLNSTFTTGSKGAALPCRPR